MVLAAFDYYVNNKIISVVEITFVDESQNVDFEKSGKCSQQRRRNSHGFTKLNAIRVMLNEMKTLLGKMQNCRVLKARTLKVRTPMTFEMTFDPQITGRATMGVRFKNNFTAWR